MAKKNVVNPIHGQNEDIDHPFHVKLYSLLLFLSVIPDKKRDTFPRYKMDYIMNTNASVLFARNMENILRISNLKIRRYSITFLETLAMLPIKIIANE